MTSPTLFFTYARAFLHCAGKGGPIHTHTRTPPQMRTSVLTPSSSTCSSTPLFHARSFPSALARLASPSPSCASTAASSRAARVFTGATLSPPSWKSPAIRYCHPLSVIACTASMAEPVEVLVKAAVGEPDKIGDCPFSHRVLLTLEEKGVPYSAKYVDLVNKPDWFLEINPEGKVPVIKHEGKWVPDSDVITQILEEKFPEPPLLTPAEKAAVGSKLFPSFVKFLKSKDPSDGTEEALIAELKLLNEHLKEHGPFINGEKVCATDLSLAPKLYHLQIALGHYKKWAIPDDLTYLKNYIEALHARESFAKTKPAHEHVVAGWQKHVS